MKYLKALFIFLLLSDCVFAEQGGISLDSTRIIYYSQKKSYDVHILNSDKEQTYLIQSWIEDGNGKRSEDFILTPPLFISNSESENLIKLNLIGQVKEDRETLYWLNVKSIPSQDKSMKEKNTLQIAIITRIKVIVRPRSLKGLQSARPEKDITFKSKGGNIIIFNPTPAYITLTNININGRSLDNIMLSPKSESNIKLNEALKVNSQVGYQSINDFGGLNEKVVKHLEP